jgi:hypothetical protein
MREFFSLSGFLLLAFLSLPFAGSGLAQAPQAKALNWRADHHMHLLHAMCATL